MVPETNDISKMDKSIEPPKASSPAALGNKLESVHSLKDQTIAPEERIGNTGIKLMVHEEQKASPKNNDFRTPGTKFTKRENSSSCWSMSGILEILKQSIDENGASVCGMANNLKRAPSLDLSVYSADWVAQRPHKLSRTQQTNAVSLITINDESQVASRSFMAFEPGSSSSFNTAHCSSFGTSLGNNYLKMERKSENAGSPIGLPGRDESGVRQSMLKENGSDAVGDTLVTDRKAGAIKRESSDNMQGQGLIMSKLTEVDPRKEKIENVPSTMPTRSRGHSSNKDKRCSPLKKERNYKASVLSGHHRNDKLSDHTGELDDDHKDLLAAACSVHTANKNACSGPFWKQMERIFAPVTSQDLLFLKQQLVDHAEELNQSQSHITSDACDAAGVAMKRREVSNLDQRLVKPIAFGRPNTVKKINAAPSLFRRVLSAMIDEDEGKDLYSQNEGRSMFFKCTSHDSHFDSYSHKDCDSNNMDRVESEIGQEEDLPSQKHFPLDGLSSKKSASSDTNSIQNVFSTFGNNGQGQADDGLSYSNAGSYQRVPILMNPSQVNSPSICPFNCQYQMLSLDDKLSLELQNIALNPEIMPHLDDGEECIDQEIKGLQRKLYQQVAEVKNNMGKIEKAILCEQELEKRNIEESAMDRLVEMAYKRMGGQRSKSSRIRKISKQVALAFVKRTLSRCKQFEEIGRSCFSQPCLQDVIFYKPPCEKDVKPTDRNCFMIVSKEVPKKAKRQGVVQRLDSQSDNLQRGSSGLQQTSLLSSELLSGHGFIFNKWKKEPPNQVVGSASSKAAEVERVTNPAQVHTGFSGADQPPSRPSGLFSIYDFMFIKDEMKVHGDIANASSSKANTSRQGGVMGEINVENRDKKGDAMARHSSSESVHKSKAKPKKKRLLSRIGLQEVACSAQMLELKSSDPIANAYDKQFLPPANDSQDASRYTRSMKIAQLDLLDTPTNDVFNALAGAEDLSSLLDFDEGGLLDHDSAGLEVPMDDLADVDMFL